MIVRSGYELSIPDDEPVDDLVVAVAADELSMESLRLWFTERLRRQVQ